MYKLIPIKVQRIFMFIPYLNVLVMFMYIYNLYRYPDGVSIFLKSIWRFFVFGVIPMIFFSVLERIFSNVSIIFYIGCYVEPLLLAYGFIEHQKKHIDFSKG